MDAAPFERDLLDAIVSGFDLSVDGEGVEIDPAHATCSIGAGSAAAAERSRPRPAQGGGDRHCPAARWRAIGSRTPTISRACAWPCAAYWPPLGGRGLKSWECWGGLGRMNSRDPPSSAS
jgi:hypothetical protein